MIIEFLCRFSSIKQTVVGKHPLEALERTHNQRIDNRNFMMLRSIQGIHAPLRLIAERRAAKQIGRLPFLTSSNVMLEVLDGRDETIGVEDFLNGLSFIQSFLLLFEICYCLKSFYCS